MHAATYHFVTVDGHKIFYREAGEPALPTIILLHGFPTSSHMYRDLIPLLADRFHVIAADYIGFGQSDAPSAQDFHYSFDSLTAHVAGLIDQLGLKSYILYMQDYGGPVGFRLFTQHPERIRGFVIQNANAYLEGVGDMPKQIFLPLWNKRIRKRSAPITGHSIRRCSIVRARMPINSICSRTTNPTWQFTTPGTKRSVDISRKR
jgi:pimeloyl-ACP methyl ester carboxylesterase